MATRWKKEKIMTERITEILEDGTVHCFDMDKCITEADKVMDQLYEREGELDYDFVAVVFSLFINSIHVLSDHGWSTEELIKEVVYHSQDIEQEE
jgi:hypothetical protein